MKEVRQRLNLFPIEDEMNTINFPQNSEFAGSKVAEPSVEGNGQPAPSPQADSRGLASSFPNRMSVEMAQFSKLLTSIRGNLTPAFSFEDRCQQAFNLANDLFGNAPTWICFYREMLGGQGLVHELFPDRGEFGRFLRSEQYHQIQLMLTALRSRDLPENDPNDPQRMITVRLPKSLHEAMCDEAARLNISVNRLCISRMLQLLDPKMIPETQSKPRGRKPRLGKPISSNGSHLQNVPAPTAAPQASPTCPPDGF
jgi:hypothetical protein